MSEIELAELESASAEAGVGDAVAASEAASEEAAQTISDESEQLSQDDINNFSDAVESGDVSKLTNPDLRTAGQKIIDSAKQTLAKVSEAFQRFNPKANFTELKLEDNFDASKVGDDVAAANKDVLSREEAGIRKKIPDLDEAGKKFEKAADEESNATKKARYQMYTRLFGILAVGAAAGGLIAALKGISDGMTGCYEVQVGKGQNKLECSNVTSLQTNCMCNVQSNRAFTSLTDPTGNGCVVDSTHTCPAFQYVYKKVYWWDVLANIGNALQGDFDDVFGKDGLLPKLGAWAAKNWWVILLLVCVPFILYIILQLVKKNS